MTARAPTTPQPGVRPDGSPQVALFRESRPVIRPEEAWQSLSRRGLLPGASV
jgi:hypothetical protein